MQGNVPTTKWHVVVTRPDVLSGLLCSYRSRLCLFDSPVPQPGQKISELFDLPVLTCCCGTWLRPRNGTREGSYAFMSAELAMKMRTLCSIWRMEAL